MALLGARVVATLVLPKAGLSATPAIEIRWRDRQRFS